MQADTVCIIEQRVRDTWVPCAVVANAALAEQYMAAAQHSGVLYRYNTWQVLHSVPLASD